MGRNKNVRALRATVDEDFHARYVEEVKVTKARVRVRCDAARLATDIKHLVMGGRAAGFTSAELVAMVWAEVQS